MFLTRMKVVLLGTLLLGILSSVAVSQQDGGRSKDGRCEGQSPGDPSGAA